jgi:hypothetical protein
VSSGSGANCGSPTVIFMTSTGFSIEVIFTIECDDNNLCQFIVWTDLTAYAGSYEYQFIFYYSGMPSVTITSEVFVIIVVDICVPPPGCITIIGCGIPDPVVNPPSIDIEIEVTVTVDTTIELPPWSCGTPGCDAEVIVVCVDCDIGETGVVVIVNNEISITIDSCIELCAQEGDSTTIVVVIEGCLGTVCCEVEVPVVIYNPCLDINFFGIMPVTVPDIECELYGSCTWEHQTFIIIGTT